MPAPSKTARLDPKLREALAELWATDRYSLDDLIDHMRSLALGDRSNLPPVLAKVDVVPSEEDLPSRSGLARHLSKVEKTVARWKRSQQMAEALVSELGDASEDKLARSNFTALHMSLNEALCQAFEALEGGDEGQPITMDAKTIMQLASAAERTESAKKKNQDYRAQVEKEVRDRMLAEQKAKLDAMPTKGGVSAEAMAQIREALGIR